jgi:hypothetical protein
MIRLMPNKMLTLCLALWCFTFAAKQCDGTSIPPIASLIEAPGLVIVDGCTDSNACNFESEATTDDGSCEYESCAGCMSFFACNFNPEATISNPEDCDYSFCTGCTDNTACNFDPTATLSNNATCVFPENGSDCADAPSDCIGCDPVFLNDLSGFSVECAIELPMQPLENVPAGSACSSDLFPVSSFVGDGRTDYISNAGFSSEGFGPTGAVRIFGLTALGLADSDYFIETLPFILTRFTNGTALVTGQVVNALNNDIGWNVSLVFEDRQDASSWLEQSTENSLVIAFGCDPDTVNWDVYRLKGDQSFLIGMGEYEGSYLQLSHMPVGEHKRFQIGNGANSSNCAYGFGGWFAWQGQVLGNEVLGMTGDLVMDLDSDGVHEVDCGEEMVAHFYSVLNPSCAQLTQTTQIISREDMSPPSWADEGCAPEVVLCFDAENDLVNIPAACDFAFEDSCNEPVINNLQENTLSGDPLSGEPFIIERIYSGTDCSGNVGVYVQTLVFDGAACPEAPGMHQENHHSVRYDAEPENRALMLSSTLIDSRIQPNPSNGNATLIWSNLVDGEVLISVHHITGQAVMTNIKRHAEADEQVMVSLPGDDLPSGSYVIRLQFNREFVAIPWVVAH